MFIELDALMTEKLPQLELYCKIGRLVGSRPEKGAVGSIIVADGIIAIQLATGCFSDRWEPLSTLLLALRR